ncbi:MAG: NADH-quinone oxidoreductase subunit M [Candidatus Wallbacteria bacterium]|nr:NADH-quinone oxidoreductase subunit M [Candidatus Wallbacteria bacterium]
MTFLSQNLLTVLVFLPAVGALALALMPSEEKPLLRWSAVAFSGLAFVLSLGLLNEFHGSFPSLQFVESRPWIAEWGITWFVGVDGLSILLVVLTAFLTPVVALSAFSAVEEGVKGYYVSLLMLETAMLGALVALDIFLFYVFWELMLIPMFFLIGVWGGPRRIYAAVKFMLFTLVGSLPMLVAVLYIYFAHKAQAGSYSAALPDLLTLKLSPTEQLWLFAAFALAFAVKVPLFPLHTWLPDAHVEAPTGGSVILAGVLLKMGTYGFVRFAVPLFPGAAREAAPVMLTLAVIGIVYGALVSLVQTDIKKLVAYSSVSHLGYVMLGIFTLEVAGLQGALYGMISHGLTTGALFLLIGVIYERRHTRQIDEFGGLARQMPVYAVLLMFATLGSVGLPGLSGFVGEFLVLLSAFSLSSKVYVVLASTGLVFGALYMLWLVHKVLWGPLGPKNQKLPDVSAREIAYLAPVIVMIVWMGVFPNTWMNTMRASAEHWARDLDHYRLTVTARPGPAPALLTAQSEHASHRPAR